METSGGLFRAMVRSGQRAVRRPYVGDGPSGGLTNQGFRIMTCFFKDGQGGRIALIAQNDGRVSQEAAPLAAHQRRAAKTLPKCLFGESHDFQEIEGLQVRSCFKGGLPPRRRLAVPGADFLADIAAEY